MDDADLVTFMEITGCNNITTATEYLSFGGGLENAISLYMTSQEGAQRSQPDVEFAGERSIRNPIEARTEQLVDDFSMHYENTDFDSDLAEPFHESSPLESDPVWQRNDTLSALFAPPQDLIFNGTTVRAKKEAVEKSKMLLVSIHDPSDFQCQILNRDLWKNVEVKDVVSKYFLFLQLAKNSPDGQEHITFYPFHKYPYICVLDPLTGERIKFWNDSPIMPEAFILELLDLVDLNDPKKSKGKKKDVGILSEEEQLELALKLSANGGEIEFIKEPQTKPVKKTKDAKSSQNN